MRLFAIETICKNMKNKFNFGLILIAIIGISLGCSRISESLTGSDNAAPQTTNSNKSIIDQTTENIADGETTGIVECDEVMRIIGDQSKNSDDDWATKAAKDYFIGQIKKSFRESLKENKDDQAKMAEQCRDFKKDLEKNLKEEKEKKR